MSALVKKYITFVIGISNSSKAFLTSSIPNLKFNVSAIRINSFKSKVNTNSCHVILIKLIICESEKKTTFSNRRITYNNIFKEVIVLPVTMAHLNYFTTNDIITYSEINNIILERITTPDHLKLSFFIKLFKYLYGQNMHFCHLLL